MGFGLNPDLLGRTTSTRLINRLQLVYCIEGCWQRVNTCYLSFVKGNTMTHIIQFVTDICLWIDYQSMEIVYILFGDKIGF